MKRHVFIAVPTLDGKVTAALTHFLCAAESMNHDPSSKWSFSKAFYLGYKPVDYMRNSQFRDFLASDCERLWLLDADIMPPMRGFELLDVDADIVAGAIPIYKGAAAGNGIALQLAAFERDGDDWTPLTATGDTVREIDGAGAGCMVIKRRVLEDARMRHAPDLPKQWQRDGWCPSIYRVRTEPWGQLMTTGDLDLCKRAKALGYSIKLWPHQLWGQSETLDLRDVAAYGARCAATAEKVTA